VRAHVGSVDLYAAARAKGVALVCYLALTGREQPRSTLATLLWGEMAESGARANLRVVLATLHHHLGARLAISRHGVAYVPAAADWVDVQAFEAHLRSAQSAPAEQAITHLRSGLDLYTGDFLAGFQVRHAPEFEEWRTGERDRLENLATATLLELADRYVACEQTWLAADCLERLLTLQPGREAVHRKLMRLLAASADQAAVEAAFERCRRALATHLGVEPSRETLDLWNALRAGGSSAPVAVVTAPPTGALATPLNERRQVTVLAFELVESATLARQLDVEDLASAIAVQDGRCRRIIAAWGGWLAPSPPGTWLAYFGYPSATPNNAYRAVCAAREIVSGSQLRAGIDTSLVLVAEHAPQSGPVGAAPIEANALMRLAPLGSAVVSTAVSRLLADRFELRALPDEGSRAFAVGRQRRRPSHTQHRAERPLVGRRAELDRLLDAWRRAEQGHGGSVLVIGDPGVGKTRLTEALQADLRQTDSRHLGFVCRCDLADRASPLMPALDLIRQYLPADGDPDALRRLLNGTLDTATADGVAAVSALADWLDLSAPGADATRELPSIERVIGVLADWVRALCRRRPLLLIVEDLHWADPSSLDLLDVLAAIAAELPLLVVLTARPEFVLRPNLAERAEVVRLGGLSEAELRQLLIDLLARHGADVSSRTLESIAARSGGVPLFAEELTLSAIERTAQADAAAVADRHSLPIKLREVLGARLDRLGSAREVAQVGACIGQRFTVDLLKRVSESEQASIEQQLEQLVAEGVLEPERQGPRASFGFTHVLLQEAAYESLPIEDRKRLHQRIVTGILDGPSPAAVRPEVLAQHMALAGSAWSAIAYWKRAALRAVQRSANREAVNHVQSALTVLATLPDDAQRTREELGLQTVLIVPLAATLGYSSAEVGRAYARVAELAQVVEQAPSLAPVLWGLASYYGHTGRLDLATTFVDQLSQLAANDPSASLEVEAHVARGYFAHHRGDFAEACRELQAGVACYDPIRHGTHTLIYGVDPRIYCTATLAHDLWFQGYPDQAIGQSEIALAMAEVQEYPVNLALALALETILRWFLGEPEAVRAVAARTAEVCRTYHLPHYWALVSPLDAAARLSASDLTEDQRSQAFRDLRAALAMAEAMGIELQRTHCLAVLASACLHDGDPNEGLQAVEGALAAVERGDRWFEAELWRLKAELLSVLRKPSDVIEECLARAVSVSRRQGARTLELRAQTSLVRLRAGLGAPSDAYEQARTSLATLCGSFDEGDATLDMRTARAVLRSSDRQAAEFSVG
jgi:DNA-binding SARP family transcriptional activator/tetratricopeptide (TPR) repeat protein